MLPMIIEELKARNQKMIKLYNLEHVEQTNGNLSYV